MSNPITIDALEVMDAIASKGSYAAAANALYRVPSSVTYTVSKLEEQLGVVLFRKEGRRSVLTPAGMVLLEQGREILQATQRLAEMTRQVEKGWESQLTIVVDTILDTRPIYELLKDFYHEVGQQVEVRIQEGVLGGSWEPLLEGQVDLVVGASDPIPGSSNIAVKEIDRVQFVFVVSPGHPLVELHQQTGLLTKEDIESYRAVVVRDSSVNYAPVSKRVFARESVLTVPSLKHKIDAQINGLGVGFLPHHRITAELAEGLLVPLNIDVDLAPTPIYGAWKKGSTGKALRWFVDGLERRQKQFVERGL